MYESTIICLKYKHCNYNPKVRIIFDIFGLRCHCMNFIIKHVDIKLLNKHVGIYLKGKAYEQTRRYPRRNYIITLFFLKRQKEKSLTKSKYQLKITNIF